MINAPGDSPWMTAHEAAAYLRLEVSTLSKHRQLGTGPRYSARLGRDPRYRREDLDAWLSGAMVANTTEAKHVRAVGADAGAGNG